jgi:hypothetical protein
MVINASLHNISTMSWRSVLFYSSSHSQTLLHNVVSSTPRMSRLGFGQNELP